MDNGEIGRFFIWLTGGWGFSFPGLPCKSRLKPLEDGRGFACLWLPCEPGSIGGLFYLYITQISRGYMRI